MNRGKYWRMLENTPKSYEQTYTKPKPETCPGRGLTCQGGWGRVENIENMPQI